MKEQIRGVPIRGMNRPSLAIVEEFNYRHKGNFWASASYAKMGEFDALEFYVNPIRADVSDPKIVSYGFYIKVSDFEKLDYKSALLMLENARESLEAKNIRETE